MFRILASAFLLAVIGISGAPKPVGAQELWTPRSDGNDFLCSRWGCAGGTLAGSLSAWRSTPEGTFTSNFGWTLGLDVAAPIPYLQDYGLGVQFAGSYGQFDLNGRASVNPPDALERQHFYSVGVFRRPDASGPWWSRWGAGVAYDILIDDSAGELEENFVLRQWRVKASYDITDANEVGIWGAIAGPTVSVGQPLGSPVTVDQYRPLDQINIFYKRRFVQGGSLAIYWGPGIGGALPLTAVGRPYYGLKWTAGAQVVAPLSDFLALFADGAYGDPNVPGVRFFSASSTQSYSLAAGLRFYWGGNARTSDDRGRHWMPYLPDPDNGNFFTQSNFSF